MSNLNVTGLIKLNGDCIFPVGHILLETSTTEPASLYGGTWYKLGAGYALWTATSGAVTVNSSGTITSGTISAGLPNIYGEIGNLAHYPTNIVTSSGALYSGGRTGNAFTGSTSASGLSKIAFNASQSNSIYGNSTTVQPPAIKVYAWIRTA